MTGKVCFEVGYTQFLNANAEVVKELPLFAKNFNELLAMYREMVLSRIFDIKSINLQRTGKIGTIITTVGQEALGVGIGYALKPDDVFVTAYREHATQLKRGVKISDILSYFGGDERGNVFENSQEDLPITVTLGSQLLHAAGIAKAIQYRKEKRAVLTVCGDGTTSEGVFYEAMNVAGVWKLPIVFIVNNNQWAISTPHELQTAAKTYAQKAIACGFEGEQVDGNDLIAVRHVIEQALEKARKGGGPALIEAKTYRLGAHTTADDPTRYRAKHMMDEAWKTEPLSRLRNYLEKHGQWNEEREQLLDEECKAEVDKGVEEYLSKTPQKPTDMFEYLYETLPEPLLEQYEELR